MAGYNRLAFGRAFAVLIGLSETIGWVLTTSKLKLNKGSHMAALVGLSEAPYCATTRSIRCRFWSCGGIHVVPVVAFLLVMRGRYMINTLFLWQHHSQRSPLCAHH